MWAVRTKMNWTGTKNKRKFFQTLSTIHSSYNHYSICMLPKTSRNNEEKLMKEGEVNTQNDKGHKSKKKKKLSDCCWRCTAGILYYHMTSKYTHTVPTYKKKPVTFSSTHNSLNFVCKTFKLIQNILLNQLCLYYCY